jgi:hypothetical protein
MKWAITTEDFPWMLPTKFRFIWPNGFREESNFFNSFLFFTDFLRSGNGHVWWLKNQMQSNHMERMHMWSSFKIFIEDLRLSSNVAVTVTILPLCSIYRHGGQDGWSEGSSDIYFKGNPLRMIQAKFGLNWPSGFRGEDFWKSLQTKNPEKSFRVYCN